MDKASEIQLSKAIVGKNFSKTESHFILSVLNEVGSFREVLNVMESYSTARSHSDTIISGFTLKQHVELSSLVLSKVKTIELDESDISAVLAAEEK